MPDSYKRPKVQTFIHRMQLSILQTLSYFSKLEEMTGVAIDRVPERTQLCFRGCDQEQRQRKDF